MNWEQFIIINMMAIMVMLGVFMVWLKGDIKHLEDRHASDIKRLEDRFEAKLESKIKRS